MRLCAEQRQSIQDRLLEERAAYAELPGFQLSDDQHGYARKQENEERPKRLELAMSGVFRRLEIVLIPRRQTGKPQLQGTLGRIQRKIWFSSGESLTPDGLLLNSYLTSFESDTPKDKTISK